MEIIARISQIFHQTKIALFPLEESLGEDFMAEVQRGALKVFRLACGMAIVAGLSFALVYELIFPARSYELLPLMAAMVLVGMMGIVFSLTPSGKRHPRGLSLVVANAIGTLLTVSQLGIGSHTYGHFGGLSIILLVMATLGTLKPFSVLVSAIYIVGLYFSTGIFLDRSVGWPPPATFILPCAFLAFSGIIAVGLTVFFHRTRRTEFLLRDELSRALRVLQETQAQLLASEKALTQSQVVAALSHELNNPGGVIASNLFTPDYLQAGKTQPGGLPA